MIVMKFGGTSVGTAERMKNVASLVKQQEGKVIVVLSAMSGTTNRLVEISQQFFNKNNQQALMLIDDLKEKYCHECAALFSSDKWLKTTGRFIDETFNKLKSYAQDIFTTYEEKEVLAQGELLSTTMMINYMQEIDEMATDCCKHLPKSHLADTPSEHKFNAKMLFATDYMMIDKDGIPILSETRKHLNQLIDTNEDKNIFITQGFIARNAFGEIDNLKRGGSDYSATLIGAAINAEEVQIWTDIDGVHNADPRCVDNTYPLPFLTYDEASELAYFGAKILHPTCVKPAQEFNIPIRLKNTMLPLAEGTLISNDEGDASSHNLIKALATKEDMDCLVLTVGKQTNTTQLLATTSTILNAYDTNCILLTCSEKTISLCIEHNEHIKDIVEELSKMTNANLFSDVCIITAVGTFNGENAKQLGNILSAVRDHDIIMVSANNNSNSISVVCNQNDKKDIMSKASNAVF